MARPPDERRYPAAVLSAREQSLPGPSGKGPQCAQLLVLAALALSRFVGEPPQEDNFPDGPVTVLRPLEGKYPLPNALGHLPETKATMAQSGWKALRERPRRPHHVHMEREEDVAGPDLRHLRGNTRDVWGANCVRYPDI